MPGIALGLALGIQAFLIKPYRIPSASMEPTLDINQRILVNRLAVTFGRPRVGEIVVFHPPKNYDTCADAEPGSAMLSGGMPRMPSACDVAQTQGSASVQTFVKRVVGLPGDHLSIRNGRVFRNGRAESTRQTRPCDGDPGCNFPGTIVVPKNDYYVMGDNRPDSDDSRYWGPVRRSWIIGQVIFSYWPPDRVCVCRNFLCSLGTRQTHLVMAKSTTKKPKSALANVIELVLTVAVAVGLALLVQAFLVKPYKIPSGSMIPTLDIGQRAC